MTAEQRAQASEARVIELEAQIADLDNSWAVNIQERDAFEAQVVELAGALGALVSVVSLAGYIPIDIRPILSDARTVLATLPAAALERASAKNAVVKAAQFFWEDGVAEDSPELNQVAWQAMDKALANLDALDPPTEENAKC